MILTLLSQKLNVLINSADVVLYRIKHTETIELLSLINFILNRLIFYFKFFALFWNLFKLCIELIEFNHEFIDWHVKTFEIESVIQLIGFMHIKSLVLIDSPWELNLEFSGNLLHHLLVFIEFHFRSYNLIFWNHKISDCFQFKYQLVNLIKVRKYVSCRVFFIFYYSFFVFGHILKIFSSLALDFSILHSAIFSTAITWFWISSYWSLIHSRRGLTTLRLLLKSSS